MANSATGLLKAGCPSDALSSSSVKAVKHKIQLIKNTQYSNALVINCVLTDQGDMSDVVPDISDGVIRCNGQCSHEAVECHVILLGIEATKTEIVVQLCIAHSHLQQPPDTPAHASSVIVVPLVQN